MNKTEKSFNPYGCVARGSFEADQRLQRLSRLSISFSKDAQSMLRRCKCTNGNKVQLRGN